MLTGWWHTPITTPVKSDNRKHIGGKFPITLVREVDAVKRDLAERYGYRVSRQQALEFLLSLGVRHHKNTKAKP